MASTEFTGRSNYFRVTDEDKWEKLFSGLSSEDIYDLTKEENGVTLHGFGCYGSLEYYDTEKSIKEIFEANEKVYNENGDEITLEEAMEEDEIFDNKGECIFSKWDVDSDFDEFIKKLQTILPDEEIFIYTEVCNEKLRYVEGYVTIVSNSEYKSASMTSYIDKTLESMVGEEKAKNISRPCY